MSTTTPLRRITTGAKTAAPSASAVDSRTARTVAAIDDANASPSTLAPRLLTLPAAAAYLGGVCTRTVQDWIRAGRIPAVELPPLRPLEGDRPRQSLRRVLIDRRDVDAFVDSLPRTPAAPVPSRARDGGHRS